MRRFGALSRFGQFFLVALGFAFIALPSAAQSQYIYKNVDVNFADSSATGASGINNAGTIVGGYTGADGFSHGFEDVNGTFTTVDFPTCPTSFCRNGATGINNLGEIVGF
jgi:hypothetical protein